MAYRKLFHLAKRWALALSLLYLLLLGLLTLGLSLIGEKHPLVAALLYLPPSFYIAPTIPILFVVGWLKPRLLWISLPVILGLSLLLFQFNIPSRFVTKPQVTSPLELTVLSFNIGQSGNTSQEKFILQHRPDLVALQEVYAKSRSLLKLAPYANYPYAVHVGEFSLFSQYPILERKIVLGRTGPIAARCVLDVMGEPICVYIVHLKSPRKALRLTMAWPWDHPMTGSLETKTLFHFWENQMQDAKNLAEQYESEPLPCIVLGDTNAPPLGLIHQRLTRKFTDVHEQIRWGPGYTFPGESPFRLTAYGPWIRLDKVLINHRWAPILLEVEPHLPSQHRSLVAKLALLPEVYPSP